MSHGMPLVAWRVSNENFKRFVIQFYLFLLYIYNLFGENFILILSPLADCPIPRGASREVRKIWHVTF